MRWPGLCPDKDRWAARASRHRSCSKRSCLLLAALAITDLMGRGDMAFVPPRCGACAPRTVDFGRAPETIDYKHAASERQGCA